MFFFLGEVVKRVRIRGNLCLGICWMSKEVKVINEEVNFVFFVGSENLVYLK